MSKSTRETMRHPGRRPAAAWLLSTAILSGMLAAAPAMAQDAAGAKSDDGGEIIVTARRQSERLQDVPASVAVLTSTALARTGATKADDFTKLTPGVTIVTGTAEAGDTQINIRGMNGARDAESSVALVVDGILKTNTAQLNQAQGTLSQVEILKGPQAAVNQCFSSTAALTGYGVNPPGGIGAIPVPFIFAPANGSTFGPYSPTTCDGIQYQMRKQKDVSGELRLVSNGNGPVNWQLGAYFLHIDRKTGVSLGADEGQGVIKQLYNAPNTTNPTSLLLADKFKTNVFAGFGALEYKPNDQFNAGLALRYDIEDRKSSTLVPVATDPFTGGPINPGQAFGALVPQKNKYEQFEPKITLAWHPAPEFNIYANWGIGFKSGGFNNQGSAAVVNASFNNGVTPGTINAGVNISDQYRKEKSSAFEAGIKGSLLDDRVTFDLAGYYTQVTDMQFFEFFVGSFGLLRVVSNIDKVDIKGAELSLNVKILPGWRIFGSGNVTDSEIKKNSSRPYTVGNKSPYTADYTINLGTEVVTPVSGLGKVVLRGDYRITGPTWFSTVQNQVRPTIFSGLLPISALGAPAFVGDANYALSKRKAFAVLDLRASLEMGNVTVTAFAKNALNRKYLAEVIPAIEFGGSFISPGGRRLVGGEVSIKF